jgi:hypothetical protein
VLVSCEFLHALGKRIAAGRQPEKEDDEEHENGPQDVVALAPRRQRRQWSSGRLGR